ncbi:hypothetical protein [Streptosporangium roseum]
MTTSTSLPRSPGKTGVVRNLRGNWYRMRDTCDLIEADLGLAITRPATR